LVHQRARRMVRPPQRTKGEHHERQALAQGSGRNGVVAPARISRRCVSALWRRAREHHTRDRVLQRGAGRVLRHGVVWRDRGAGRRRSTRMDADARLRVLYGRQWCLGTGHARRSRNGVAGLPLFHSPGIALPLGFGRRVQGDRRAHSERRARDRGRVLRVACGWCGWVPQAGHAGRRVQLRGRL